MKTVAVIGSGIAGLSCAYFLRDRYRVTVYEKNSYIGGHTNTVYVPEGTARLPVDTGFMVYNDVTYPNLLRFFKHLDIQARETSMSFSVCDVAHDFETSFTSLTTFFPKLTHWSHLQRYRLLLDLRKLFACAKAYLAQPEPLPVTLAEFVRLEGISDLVTRRFLLPMTAAIWSTPASAMLEYPAETLFRFLSNHGMLGFGEQFQWKTLVGGSQQYKGKILAKLASSVETGNGARSVRRAESGAEVVDAQGQSSTFDHVIIATHADQALGLLAEPDRRERALLSSFKYNINPVALHTDASVMPSAKQAWASWNYRYEQRDGETLGSTHYWMNRLQEVPSRENYFVSVDYKGSLDESKVKWRHVYEHPRFDNQAIEAQRSLPDLNESGPIFFCGSYFRYGFHEDAFTSALAVCKRLNDGKDPLP